MLIVLFRNCRSSGNHPFGAWDSC